MTRKSVLFAMLALVVSIGGWLLVTDRIIEVENEKTILSSSEPAAAASNPKITGGQSRISDNSLPSISPDLSVQIQGLEEQIQNKQHLLEFDRISQRINSPQVGNEERAQLFARIEEVARMRKHLINLLEMQIDQEIRGIQ